ncbi:hypothetical protein LCGC14_0902440 [marine sediment metagenome]|uniref:Uncharacterized protein n=1 Tax=marine sediment metagenome TaxID=412755 RepID=A0A0F9NVZ1_9ZZZZ
MTKQQEIREGIDEYVDDDCLYPKTGCVHMPSKDFEYCNDRDGAYKCLTKRLTEIGVVIKVDRELPLMPTDPTLGDCLIWRTQQDMVNAGYVAVESLIDD